MIVKHRYVQPPLIPNAIEPRGVVARPEPGGDVTLWSATQVPHILRVLTAATLGMSETKLRVIAPDVGGGFGSKLDVYAEELLAVAIARRLGSPVKWVEERSENALATIHGRDFVTTLELAATKDGKITSLRANVLASMGAYLQLVTPGIPLLGAWIYAGPYAIPNYSVTFTGVFTNTTPTDAYRGAGRPEATYVLERTMDLLAKELGMDRIELRRKNFITEFPATIASGLTIDNGDYHASLDRLLEHLGLEELEAEQQARRDRGDVKQIGVGFSTYNEMCGLAPSRILGAIRYAAGGWESATIRCLPTGTFQVVTGTSPHGQGHETAWSQIVADQLGCDPSEVEVLHGDTSISPYGLDTYGSRSLPVGGAALWSAGEKIIEKARQIVAHQLEVSADDLEYEAGTFTVKGSPDKEMTVKGAAWAAFAAHNLPDGMEPNLEATATYDPPNFSWPGGAHAAVVEVDTGDGRRAPDPLRGGRRRRHGGQPADRRRPGARRHHAGHRDRAVRGGALRRGRQPRERNDGDVPRAVGGRAAVVRARPHGEQGDGSSVRRQGRGGDGDDRRGARRDQRRDRCSLPSRRDRYPDAGDSGESLARDRGGEAVIPAAFDYEVAESVEHALGLLGADPDAKVLAGGHSLVPALKLRVSRPSKLVDIGRLSDLAYVRDAGAQLAIGALTRHAAVHGDPLLQEHCPIVSTTAGKVGDPQVRHRGTIGGSLAHGDPASDLPAVMLALDAEFVIVGAGGERTVAAADFFTGVFQTAVGQGELLTEIRVPKLGDVDRVVVPEVPPPRAGLGDGRRRGGRPPRQRHGDAASVALTNMGGTPLRASAVEDAVAAGCVAGRGGSPCGRRHGAVERHGGVGGVPETSGPRPDRAGADRGARVRGRPGAAPRWCPAQAGPASSVPMTSPRSRACTSANGTWAAIIASRLRVTVCLLRHPPRERERCPVRARADADPRDAEAASSASDGEPGPARTLTGPPIPSTRAAIRLRIGDRGTKMQSAPAAR